MQPRVGKLSPRCWVHPPLEFSLWRRGKKYEQEEFETSMQKRQKQTMPREDEESDYEEEKDHDSAEVGAETSAEVQGKEREIEHDSFHSSPEDIEPVTNLDELCWAAIGAIPDDFALW